MRRDRRTGQNIARAASNCRLTVGGRLTVDFFGVDGALEKARADVDEALDGIGGENRARGMLASALRLSFVVRTTCRASQLESVGQAREGVYGL